MLNKKTLRKACMLNKKTLIKIKYGIPRFNSRYCVELIIEVGKTL
jgi:hypothetical protein